MTSPLIRKLNGIASLTDDDRGFLYEIIRPAKWIDARTDLIREGDSPADVYLILEGFACRYKITSDGKRQIMA
jgi:CRP-like cAMP-binding protein